MATTLDQLKKMTVIVADTGDVDSIQAFKPQDATTNPSLILAASKMPQYSHLFDDAVTYGLSKKSKDDPTLVSTICDKLAVNFGAEVPFSRSGGPGAHVIHRFSRLSLAASRLKSTLAFRSIQLVTIRRMQVAHKLSTGSLAKAHELIEMYKEMGIDKERVLIKVCFVCSDVTSPEGGCVTARIHMGRHQVW